MCSNWQQKAMSGTVMEWVCHWSTQGRSLNEPHSQRQTWANNWGLEQPSAGYKGRAPRQGSGRRSLLKLNAFLYLHSLRSRPICPKICFLQNRNFVGRLGGPWPSAPWIRRALRWASTVPCLVTLRLLCEIFLAAPGSDRTFLVS